MSSFLGDVLVTDVRNSSLVLRGWLGYPSANATQVRHSNTEGLFIEDSPGVTIEQK